MFITSLYEEAFTFKRFHCSNSPSTSIILPVFVFTKYLTTILYIHLNEHKFLEMHPAFPVTYINNNEHIWHKNNPYSQSIPAVSVLQDFHRESTVGSTNC